MVIFSSILPYHVILELEIGNLAQYIVFSWPNEEDKTCFFENPFMGSKVRAISVLHQVLLNYTSNRLAIWGQKYICP